MQNLRLQARRWCAPITRLACAAIVIAGSHSAIAEDAVGALGSATVLESEYSEANIASAPLDQPPPGATTPGVNSYIDPLLTEAACQGCQSCQSCSGDAWCTSRHGCADECRPISWISGPYIKAGPTTALGTGLFEGNRQAGYTISGGYRQPLGPDLGGHKLFMEFGGSYLSAFGETSRLTVGRQVLNGVTTNVNFVSTLKELQRSSVHWATGWCWGTWRDDRSNDPQLCFTTRFGGRLGSARGVFDEAPAFIPDANAQLFPNHPKTDTFGGLFVGGEAILLRRQSPLGGIELVADAEFANDWINIGDIWTGSLGTASLTFGMMFSR
jgi:hypothetical protein